MKKRAISLVEIIISTTILSVILIMLSQVVTKKVQSVANATSGTFYCFKDTQGNLNQRVVLDDGTIQEKANISECRYEFPKANRFEVTAIGGGGGGGIGRGNLSSDVLKQGESKTYGREVKLAQGYTLKEYAGFDLTPKRGDIKAFNGRDQKIILNRNSNLGIGYIKDNISSIYDYVDKKRSIFIKSGDNNKCVIPQVALYPDSIAFNGIPQGANSEYPATSGLLVSNQTVYIAKASDNENPCYGPGVNMASGYGLEYKSDQISITTLSPSENLPFQYGTKGAVGSIAKNNRQNLSGQSIVIRASEIGNGGTIGNPGTETNVSFLNISAAGGAAGGVLTKNITGEFCSDVVKLDINIINGKEPSFCFVQAYDENDQGYLQDVYNHFENVLANRENILGSKTAYYEGGIFKKSQEPDKNSFGAGGAGQGVAIKYFPIKEFKYTIPEYNRDGSVSDKNVLNFDGNKYTEEIVLQGTNGMGGAIIVEWE